MVSSYIKKLDEELDELNRRIACTDETLKQLCDQAKALTDHRDVHAAAVATARRLPPKILKEIFWHCCDVFAPSRASTDVAPLLLTRVSRYWRELALSTPSLWSSISLSISGHFDSVTGTAGGAATWLQRADKLPLRIWLSCTAPVGKKTRKRHPIIEVVMGSPYRIIQLSLDMPKKYLLEFRRFKFRLYNLERLKIVCDATENDLDAFSCAPLLTDVEYDDPSDRLVFPWYRLTRLRGDPHVSKLRYCPALVELEVDHRLEYEWEGPYVIPELRVLRINCQRRPYSLLSSLTLPSLRELTISCRCSDELSYARSYASLLTRSGFKLQNLSLRCVAPKTVLTMLAMTPSVRYLEMDKPEILQELVHRGPYRPALLPDLERLDLVRGAESAFEHEEAIVSTLREVVRSRSEGGPSGGRAVEARYRWADGRIFVV